jgi:hypothetical protein
MKGAKNIFSWWVSVCFLMLLMAGNAFATPK